MPVDAEDGCDQGYQEEGLQRDRAPWRGAAAVTHDLAFRKRKPGAAHHGASRIPLWFRVYTQGVTFPHRAHQLASQDAVLPWQRRDSNRGGAQLTEQITVSVDPEVAEIYRSASDEVRRKLEVLVNLRLRDATLSQRPLRDVMREVSRNARQGGLTPEILQSILDEA